MPILTIALNILSAFVGWCLLGAVVAIVVCIELWVSVGVFEALGVVIALN